MGAPFTKVWVTLFTPLWGAAVTFKMYVITWHSVLLMRDSIHQAGTIDCYRALVEYVDYLKTWRYSSCASREFWCGWFGLTEGIDFGPLVHLQVFICRLFLCFLHKPKVHNCFFFFLCENLPQLQFDYLSSQKNKDKTTFCFPRAPSAYCTTPADCCWCHLSLDPAQRQFHQRGRSNNWQGGGIPHCVWDHVWLAACRQDHTQDWPPGSRHRVWDQCFADQTSGGRHWSSWASS